MNADLEKWISEGGEKFLRDLGLKKGQTILDFGCGEGSLYNPGSKNCGK